MGDDPSFQFRSCVRKSQDFPYGRLRVEAGGTLQNGQARGEVVADLAVSLQLEASTGSGF